MKLLLDTHELLWWLAGAKALSRRAIAAVVDERNEIYVSSASAFEISTKHVLGKLDTDDDVVTGLDRHIAAAGFVALPLSVSQAVEAGRLPWHHRDPFDRLLIAQARLEVLTVVTSDSMFNLYDVKLMAA